MNEPNTIRVLVADDHPVVRRGIVLMLAYEADIEVVAEAGNGADAVEQYRTHRPDITLMDLRMPGMSGVDAIAAIRADYPAARIILLTTYDGDEGIYQALRAGARAYLLKDTPVEQVLEAIRAVHRGQKRIPQDVGAKLAERAAYAELTERELDVLRLMSQGKSNQEIAAALFVADGTVKFHVNHIFSKLGVADRTQAVIVALKRGLVDLG